MMPVLRNILCKMYYNFPDQHDHQIRFPLNTGVDGMTYSVRLHISLAVLYNLQMFKLLARYNWFLRSIIKNAFKQMNQVLKKAVLHQKFSINFNNILQEDGLWAKEQFTKIFFDRYFIYEDLSQKYMGKSQCTQLPPFCHIYVWPDSVVSDNGTDRSKHSLSVFQLTIHYLSLWSGVKTFYQ